MTDTKDKKREKLGILCCTAGATSWGLSGTCSEALFSQYPVDTTWVTAVRMTSAGIILLFLAFAKHSLNLKELGKDKKGLIEIVLFAICGSGALPVRVPQRHQMDEFRNRDGDPESIHCIYRSLCLPDHKDSTG